MKLHNNYPDDLCTVPRKRFFEIHDKLVSLSVCADSILAEIETLTTMLGGNPALMMYQEQKARADETAAELQALRSATAPTTGADQ